MKNLLTTAVMAVSVLLNFACSEKDPVIPQNQQVQFSFSLSSSPSAAGRILSEIPEDASLLISLTNATGPVFTHKSINLLKLGENFISEPLDLPVGRYAMTEFLVVNADNEIVFATPKKGSPLSEAVLQPLPFSFSMEKGKASTIDMEVLDASKQTPEAFGYISFNLTVVDPLPIAAFIEEEGDLVFTSAEAYIYKDSSDVLLQSFSLESKDNYIPFEGQEDALYRLVIKKEGYYSFIKEFSYNKLIAELDNSTLKVILKPLRNTWQIEIYIEDNGVLVPTSGQASLVRHDGSGIGYNLKPEMNFIEYNGDPNYEWELIVSKPGFSNFSTKFVFNETEEPFKVLLESLTKANSFTLAPAGSLGAFEFNISFKGTGSILLNWGDGSTETLEFSPDDPITGISSGTISHDYSVIPRVISISGDLDKIVSYTDSPYYLAFINVTSLSELTELALESATLDILDLTKNSKLTSLTLTTTSIHDLRLNNSILTTVSMDHFVSQDTPNKVVEEVYKNTVANNITDGTFTYSNGDVPLTDFALQLLEELQNSYGWELVIGTP